MPASGKVSTLFVRRCVYFVFFDKPLTSSPPQHTWVGAASSENDGCTTVNHGELDPMQLETAERTTAEETGVRREEWEIALRAEQAREQVADEARRQKKAEEMAAAECYAVEQEQLRQEQLRQQEEEKLAAEQYAAEQEQLRQQEEEEARAAAERYS
ncbi:hypothetical protein AJ78_08379, partial [Emergomyces pasteurianus Ep9510]